jgi:hypothetical protein
MTDEEKRKHEIYCAITDDDCNARVHVAVEMIYRLEQELKLLKEKLT